MLTANELLVEGEKLLGSYNVEIARWTNSRWVSTVPPLFAILTDHRMILQPHARKRHEPAIIPGRYITRVIDLGDDHRAGVIFFLKTGHQISLFTPASQARSFKRHLTSMMIPPESPIHIDDKLELGSLRKLIEFIEKL